MLRPLALATLLALACRGASPPPAPAPVPAAPDPPLRGDDEWALAVRESADPSARVCVVEADEEPCRGRTGGILRLSRAYADRGGSAARVFVVYTPMRDESGTFVRAPGPVMEMLFALERDGGRWRIADHRTVRAP